MMNILILGSEGFIGQNLIRFFEEKGYSLYGVDIINYSRGTYKYYKILSISTDLKTILEDTTFDICINAAGSGNVSFSISNPTTDFTANTADIIFFLENLRTYQPSCKYLHISSAAVYGNPTALPIAEDYLVKPISPYGFHKLMSEMICKEYAQIYKMHIAIVRPFSVYGIGLKKQLLWEICNKLLLADTTELFGTGNETRDFIHVNDLCNLMNCIIENGKFNCDIYNAASGAEISIKGIAQIFEQYNLNKKKITFSNIVRDGDPLNWRADIGKISALGYSPKQDIKNGIEQYINWFVEDNNK
jgi:UDP-glucose 4-epimerase